ncbi:hypothetical protein LguiA_007889 [Lonicera macranthoides]
MYSWLHPTNNWYYSDCDIRPILLSTYKNTTSSFVFGFVYNRSANAIKDGFCFFLVIALLPGDNVNDLVVLWSANRDNPVRENATLHFTADSGLELKDVDGTLVWSTNTSAVPVTRLNISDGANLMLLDSKDKVIWQSFDYPTDTWLPNQSISPNKGLTSSNSSSNLGITVLFKSKSNNNSVAFIKVQKQASKDKRKLSLVTVLVSTLSVGLVIILLVVSCYYYNMRIKWNKEEEEEEGDDQVIGALKRFPFLELKSATRDFQVKLGRGGFGSVYEGDLADGTKVAVKCLDSIGQGRKEFLAEVNTIGSGNHFNLVRLIGYCAEKSDSLFMSTCVMDLWINGSSIQREHKLLDGKLGGRLSWV